MMTRRAPLLLSLVCLLLSHNLMAASPRTSVSPTRLTRAEGFSLQFPSSVAPMQEELPAPVPYAAPGGPAPWPTYRPLPSAGALSLPAPAYVPTHREFAASFRPAPGDYEVVLLHPHTQCPVKVCFSLPPACLKKMHVDRNELEFDYGKVEVELNFKRSGRVEVEYND